MTKDQKAYNKKRRKLAGNILAHISKSYVDQFIHELSIKRNDPDTVDNQFESVIDLLSQTALRLADGLLMESNDWDNDDVKVDNSKTW